MSDKLDQMIKFGATMGAGAALAYAINRAQAEMNRAKRAEIHAVPAKPAPAAKFEASAALTEIAIPLNGTMLLCTQNLAVSGANQVLLNFVEGTLWKGNIVVFSPTMGPFAKEFADLGCAVRIGSTLTELLQVLRDVRCAVCNTIMTAHNVLELDAHNIPAMWVLHEWWPAEMLTEELAKRNDKNTSPEVVARALEVCKRTVCVCNNQLELYKPTNGQAVFVGVPEPTPDWKLAHASRPDSPNSPITAPPAARRDGVITFLTLGIVCPRKNQHWAVETFRRWAGDRTDVRLLVVGARYIRQYEIDYVDKVKASIGGDKRIELIDVTSDVDAYYRQADVLLFTSLNEVTPMVIAEAMMRSIPVITTDIAGIPEMLQNGVHGYSLPPDDHAAFGQALTDLGSAGADGQRRRLMMAAAARKHALATFTNRGMVEQYRKIALELAPPTILLDMDGVLVDWDKGFRRRWRHRSPIERAASYYMEDCVPPEHREAAREIFHSQGFFRGLPPVDGAVAAAKAMLAKGYKVLLCTSPVLSSRHCAGEKYEWVRAHLGPEWLHRVVVTSDKTSVRGDVLIDDKPKITGAHLPTWKQLMFDAPYNLNDERAAPAGRIGAWADWEARVLEVLRGDAASVADETESTATMTPASSGSDLAAAVALLPDFSHLLPSDYRKDYLAWRAGEARGAKGELDDVISRMERVQDSMMNNTSDDFTEVNVYRAGYASWRRGGRKGARGSILSVSQL